MYEPTQEELNEIIRLIEKLLNSINCPIYIVSATERGATDIDQYPIFCAGAANTMFVISTIRHLMKDRLHIPDEIEATIAKILSGIVITQSKSNPELYTQGGD